MNSDAINYIVFKSEVPNVFTPGLSVREKVQCLDAERAEIVAQEIIGLMNDIKKLPSITNCALDGFSMTTGLEMALACDLRVVSDNARVGLTETRLAIIPGGGGTQRLPRIVGPAVAKELIYTARILNGIEAHKLGVANHCVPQTETGDAAYQKALQLAQEILPNGPVGIKMAKNAINNGIEVDLASGLAIEEACYAQVIPTKDRIEALKAFKEKRKANFQGE